ncbi:MAG: CAP domain-containing protein [Paracoccus sp. (in: a-proteobacteria)]|uniref:CAP domain-containing protein n=1 Tax=Paracoccus sp. TaxID=267 RepID=UPI0026E0C9EC|nr:CAP domain-containing protein [Paracoccus sp. (in: a-proteobacteria)]MDO5612831.1 CAP domain-containing protein [Paracoccus sp. (in: a-proteobacteria)]
MRLFVFLIALFTASATWAGCTPGGAPTLIADLGRATNAMRGQTGTRPLAIEAALSRVAQDHACDLARRSTVSHRDGSGRLPMQRLRRAGLTVCYSAENVAMGTADAAGTVAAWQTSPGHARNQQSARARAMGVGVARGQDGRLLWVALYVAGCDRMASQKRMIW